MSMIRCDGCDRVFDSDDDPQCFEDTDGAFGTWRVLCEQCRETEKTGEFSEEYE